MPIIENGSASLEEAVSLAPNTRAAIRVDAVFERAGPFEIRLAVGARDLDQLQQLRYRIFYEDGGAIADLAVARTRRDLCSFDAICDHLVVVDTAASYGAGEPRIVGTYRLLRRDVAERHGGFYSAGEFDLAPLLRRQSGANLLELGRSCVHPDYRGRRVIELLWRGLWLYTRHHGIDTLIGCASLPGLDLEANRLPLSFLHHHAPLDAAWDVVPWRRCAAGFEPTPVADVRRGLHALPTLIKAYLRTGARFSRGIALDRQFGTTDVFAVMPVNEIEQRRLAHYGEPSCVSGAPVA